MQKEYTQTKEQVLEGLRTDRQGLSAQEAEKLTLFSGSCSS